MSERLHESGDRAFTFSQWLWKEKIKLMSYTTIIALLGILFNFIKPTSGYLIEQIINLNLTQPKLKILFLAIHFIFIVIVVITFLFDKYVIFDILDLEFEEEMKKANDETSIWQNLELLDKKEKEKFKNTLSNTPYNWIKFKKETNIVIDQFFYAWLACWIGWGLLYLILLIMETFSSSNPLVLFMNDQKTPLIIFFNNFSTLMILIMFLVLNVKTAKGKFLKVFTIIGTFVIVVLAFINGFIKDIPILSFLFMLLSGFFASICMTLFFGSLNSFFIRMNISIIICLHSYAALQVLFVFESDVLLKFLSDFVINTDNNDVNIARKLFEDNLKLKIGTVMMCAYILAFFSKILLFLTVRWILQTARLSFSIVQRKSANNANEGDFLLKKFSKIRTLKKVTVLD